MLDRTFESWCGSITGKDSGPINLERRNGALGRWTRSTAASRCLSGILSWQSLNSPTSFISPTALARAREQYVRIVASSCTIGNGDAHLKNFSVLYRHPEDRIELSPAYDLISTLPYIPRDSLALTLAGSKEFPERARLLQFVRQVK